MIFSYLDIQKWFLDEYTTDKFKNLHYDRLYEFSHGNILWTVLKVKQGNSHIWNFECRKLR